MARRGDTKHRVWNTKQFFFFFFTFYFHSKDIQLTIFVFHNFAQAAKGNATYSILCAHNKERNVPLFAEQVIIGRRTTTVATAS